VSPLAAALVAAAVVAIRGVAVIDVEAGTALPDRTVVIEGERIARVAPSAEVELGADVLVIDGAGLYLVPGLVDAHVHVIHPDTFAPLLLANGVTLARDLGGPTKERVALRERLARGEALGPELRVTGAIVDGDPPVWPFSEPVDTEEEARAAVRKLHAASVDEIKVYSLLEPGPFRAAIAEAHALGLRAVGHVPESVPLEDALEAGLDEIEHLSGFGPWLARAVGENPGGLLDLSGWLAYDRVPPERVRALAARVAGAKTVLCPTLVVLDRLARAKDKKLRAGPRPRGGARSPRDVTPTTRPVRAPAPPSSRSGARSRPASSTSTGLADARRRATRRGRGRLREDRDGGGGREARLRRRGRARGRARGRRRARRLGRRARDRDRVRARASLVRASSPRYNLRLALESACGLTA